MKERKTHYINHTMSKTRFKVLRQIIDDNIKWKRLIWIRQISSLKTLKIWFYRLPTEIAPIYYAKLNRRFPSTETVPWSIFWLFYEEMPQLKPSYMLTMTLVHIIFCYCALIIFKRNLTMSHFHSNFSNNTFFLINRWTFS